MRHEWLRPWAACVVLGLALGGCASTSGGPSDRVSTRSGGEDELSRGGLANVRLAQAYLAAGKTELALDRANRALKSDPGVIAALQLRLDEGQPGAARDQHAGDDDERQGVRPPHRAHPPAPVARRPFPGCAGTSPAGGSGPSPAP